MLVNNRCVEKSTEVRDEVWNYFDRIFKEHWKNRPSLGGSFGAQLQDSEVTSFEAEFTEEEV